VFERKAGVLWQVMRRERSSAASNTMIKSRVGLEVRETWNGENRASDWRMMVWTASTGPNQSREFICETFGAEKNAGK